LPTDGHGLHFQRDRHEKSREFIDDKVRIAKGGVAGKFGIRWFRHRHYSAIEVCKNRKTAM
jgi:DNA-binding PucR family transcriptional regulator